MFACLLWLKGLSCWVGLVAEVNSIFARHMALYLLHYYVISYNYSLDGQILKNAHVMKLRVVYVNSSIGDEVAPTKTSSLYVEGLKVRPL